MKMKSLDIMKFLPAFILIILVLITSSVLAATYVWENVGSPGFSAGGIMYTSLAIDNSGTPYVAYRDQVNGGKATVMKFNGTNWVNVGLAGFSEGQAEEISLAIDDHGTPYVAYRDWNNISLGVYTQKATVMKFDGLNWVEVGSRGFSADNAYYTSLAIDNNDTPYVAYQDAYNSERATVMKFNGSNWVNVGSPGFSAGQVTYTSLAIDNNGTPYVAYRDFANSLKTTVMKFNGTSWVPVGSPGFSAGGAYYTSLAIDDSGTPYVAYQDGGNSGRATVMKFDGTSWELVGLAGFSAGGYVYSTSLAIDDSGTPYVAYQDSGNSYKVMVMKFNGTEWVNVGSSGFSSSFGFFLTSLAIDNNGTPYVAYQDAVNSSKATVMKGRIEIDLNDTSLSRSAVSDSETDVGTLTPTGGISPFVFSLQQSGSVCTAENGLNNGLFTISGNTLQRKPTTPLGSYKVCVQVVDATTANDQHAYTINVVNALSDLTLDNQTIPDDRTNVGDFSVTGGTAPMVYTLETSGDVCDTTNGADNASFSISGTTLQRKSGTTAGTYDICAQAEDSYGLTTQETFTITLSAAPSNLTLDDQTVPDDETDVGGFSVTGGTAPIVYTLETSGDVCNATNGGDNASFSISGTTLQRESSTPLGTYTICVQAEDFYGYKTQQTFTINVANAIDALALDNQTIPDDRTNVGDFSVTGGTAPMVYILETSGDVCNTTNGANNASFSISGTTLQRESSTTAGTYDICAQAEDTYGLTTQETFTITISAAPSDLTLSNTSLPETRTIVGTLATVDGQSVYVYSLQTSGATCTALNGADNLLFDIEGNALKRKSTTTAGVYDICTQTLDQNGSIFQKTFAITVTADATPPVSWDATLSSTHLIDGDGPGTVVGGLLATIPGVTYQLTDLAAFPLASNFSINATGQLVLTGTADYSTARNYPIRILATAPDGSKAYLDYVITIMQDGTTAGAMGIEDSVKTKGVVSIDVLSNDLLSSGATSWDFHEIIEYPQHGTAEIGSVVYTPNRGYIGEDSVSYRACDDLGFCITALVTITVEAAPFPETGFAPGRVTQLSAQPENQLYQAYSNLLLEIPALNIQTGIIGVPISAEGWDLTWLGGQAGWLHGTAFPTWAGNSAITAHVVDANGQPGLFNDLNTLKYGDTVIVKAYGQTYEYQVRIVDDFVDPDDTSSVFKHEKYPWLTLITCKGYDEENDSYRWRVVVRAVQTKIY